MDVEATVDEKEMTPHAEPDVDETEPVTQVRAPAPYKHVSAAQGRCGARGRERILFRSPPSPALDRS